MSNPVRVRFAPSPTGYLHVGGARTALFNWLYARKVGGNFLLRIEDTDRERSSQEHVQVILDGLAWLGLDYDEEIVFQGAGLARHQALADQLLTAGKAYEEEGAIRFRMPPEEIAWDDAVYERIAFQGQDIKDWVILRSDRTPTYNFTVVADDLEMNVTHVMRGDDHISNTPKQIAVYRALGRAPPTFAHVPMIHGTDGKKLSKRHGATAVADYRKEGILPEAMRNFLALLGWNPGDDRELYHTIEDLVQAFSLERILKKAAIFDLQKLEWLNGQHISHTAPEKLYALIADELPAKGVDVTQLGMDRVLQAVTVQRERARTTHDLAHRVGVRFNAALIELDDKARKLIGKDPAAFQETLRAAHERLEAVTEADWREERLEQALRALAAQRNVKLGAVFQPVRVAVTGNAVSEPVDVLLATVGRDESLRRMRAAQEWTARG
jgi:glutamyl-tRNA synthetase